MIQLRLQELECEYGIELNLDKTVFLSSSAEFKNLEEVAGIKRVDSAKYLGARISLRRATIIKDTRALIHSTIELFED